jgi:hypothetical protein
VSPGRRRFIIGVLLIAAVGAAARVRNGVGESDAEVIGATSDLKDVARQSGAAPGPDTRRHTAPQGAQRSIAPRIHMDRLNARNPGELVRDPFAVPAPKTRKKPRAKTSPAAPPAPEAAPAVPFTYMGKLRSGADTAVFLTQGERNLILREGDTIDSVYRVEHIADSEITLVYLPLGQRQTISIGLPP